MGKIKWLALLSMAWALAAVIVAGIADEGIEIKRALVLAVVALVLAVLSQHERD